LKTCRQWKDINKSYDNISWVFDNAIITDGVSVSFQVTNEEIFGRKVFGRKRKVITEDGEDKENFEVTKRHKILGCDPGKRDILTITDGFKTIRYTKGQRDQDVYSKARKKVTLSMKRKYDIETYESQVMNKYSKRSCNPIIFHRYVCLRKRKENEFNNLYRHPVFREFKFTNYVKTKSSEDRFKHKVEKTFSSSNNKTHGCCNDPLILSNAQLNSKDIIIGWGDWGKTPNILKGVGPTPGIGIRKRFSSKFKVVSVNEYMTSKTCPCCKDMTLKVHNKHHLLRCTNDECKSRWWNRNVVGSFNILERCLKQSLNLKSNLQETDVRGNTL
jgi:transposase